VYNQRVAFPFLFLSILSLTFLSLSCDESLPPRDDPADYFKSDFYIVPQINIHTDEIWVDIYFVIHNTYSETFSDTASFDGDVTIYWLKDPTIKKTFPIQVKNIYIGSHYDTATSTTIASQTRYNSSTKILTIPGGDSVNFRLRWNYISDSSYFIPDTFHYSMDIEKNQFLSDAESFSFKAKVQLYNQKSYIHSREIIFSQIYNMYWNPLVALAWGGKLAR
jgi:hypothetical protein